MIRFQISHKSKTIHFTCCRCWISNSFDGLTKRIEFLIRFLLRHRNKNAIFVNKKRFKKSNLVPVYWAIQLLALLATFLYICRWLDNPKRPILIVPPEWVSHSMTCLSKSHRIALRFATFVGNKSSLKSRWVERTRFCIALPNRPNFQQECPIVTPSKRQPN